VGTFAMNDILAGVRSRGLLERSKDVKSYALPLLGLVVVSLAAVVTLGAASAPAPHYSVELEFGAVAGHPGAYQCQAVFKDLASGEVLAAPKVVFPAGTPARTESEIPGRGEKAMLSASVDEESGTLTYELEVRGRDTVLSRHKATVGLQ